MGQTRPKRTQQVTDVGAGIPCSELPHVSLHISGLEGDVRTKQMPCQPSFRACGICWLVLTNP
jgi:hypothetical protein